MEFDLFPECAWGLGVRLIGEANRALVTKLAWAVCVDDHKTWVQLIKARYLCGRKVLDVEDKERAMS